MELIALKNGSSEPSPLVASTLLSLRSMMLQEPIAFYEAVQIARNPSHVPFGNAAEKIDAYGLLQGGRMHESVRNIIQAAVEGDDFTLKLVRPEALIPN